MKFLTTVFLAGALAASPALAEQVQPRGNIGDAAVVGVVSLMLASLPPDVKVVYDHLASDSRRRTFEVRGLSVVRTTPGMAGTGTLNRLHIAGVDVLQALSGRPFTADRIEMDSLDVDECPDRKRSRRCRWAVGAIVIEDAEVPSFVALAQAGDTPDQALRSIRFSRATVDGRAVRTIPEALARIRGKR
ncbi:MAG: hypothetical protein HQL33_12120 [Alphaproteobacteria bacterium]|nr:hypothetical protein [Alphaproteobacteria bacterium]